MIMRKEPIVEKLVIRDDLTYGKDISLRNVKLSDAVIALDEFCINRSKNQTQRIWTCRLGFHRWDTWEIKPDSKCLECGITGYEYKRERRVIDVRNIILHIKMNVKRWRDEQLQMKKEIIDAEINRRDLTNDIHKGDMKNHDR
jgi:hypothetical protein